MDLPIQEILSGLAKVATDGSSTINATELLEGLLNATSASTNATQHSSSKSFLESSMPGSILAFVPFLFSFSALRDWLKVFLIGGILETCRRWYGYFYELTVESFWMSATFDEDDTSYQWIMVWLSTQPSWAKIRQVEVKTYSYGTDNTAIGLDDEEDEDATNSRRMFYIPSPSKTYTLWYKGRYLTITRSQEQGRWGKESRLQLTLMTRNPKLLAELLKDARKAYMKVTEDKMCIWAADSTNDWRQVARREKRSLKSIVLDPGIKDTILEDARDFLNSKKWYTERGIPFRRGYLLYGAPGSGKTSLIHSLAGELELDVYIISLSRIGLDDSGLNSLINELPERCVALMEDIDAAFTHGLTRETDEEEKRLGDKEDEEEDDEKKDKKKEEAKVTSPSSRVSLSGLLNALDGISAQEGRILFATTNKYSSLDPALCRPGRMDLHIEFKLASQYQAKELFKRFYNPNDDAHEDDEEVEEKTKRPTKKSSASDNEKPVDDSGYNTSDSNESSPLLPASSDPARSISVTGSTHQSRHTSGPRLSKSRLEKLAAEFAEAIPEREISMASLQGYLMVYKIRPESAVKDVPAWVEGEVKERREKERKRQERVERRRKQAEERERNKEKEASQKVAVDTKVEGDAATTS
ncbi:hypothetical protein PM082_002172 [Marasmius tenuissimus]|nr:hypothetical protein PM082_002172 [Marasmius tenuissimus]